MTIIVKVDDQNIIVKTDEVTKIIIKEYGVITSGSGVADAPRDGNIYGRKDGLWAEAITDWEDIPNKPLTFPVDPHTHVKADITDFVETDYVHPGDDISLLNNDAGYLVDSDISYPVLSVNTKTGAVVLTNTDVGAAATIHNHTITDVTGLQPALDGKSPVIHAHAIADVTGLQPALDGKAPLVHTHVITDTVGLQPALDGKAPVVHTHIESDITNLDKYTKAETDALVAGAITAIDYPVDSVNTKTGAVVLTYTDVQAAPTIHTHTESSITDLDKYTQAETDALIEASELQTQTGLDLKVNKAGDTITGEINFANGVDITSIVLAKPDATTSPELQIFGGDWNIDFDTSDPSHGVRLGGNYVAIESPDISIQLNSAQVGSRVVVAGLTERGNAILGVEPPPVPDYVETATGTTDVNFYLGGAVPSAWVDISDTLTIARDIEANRANINIEALIQNMGSKTGNFQIGVSLNGADPIDANNITYTIGPGLKQIYATTSINSNLIAAGTTAKLQARATDTGNTFILWARNSERPSLLKVSVVGSGGGTGATSLDELVDVSLTTPVVGEALVFDGLGVWKNAPITAGGGIPDAPNDGTQYGRQNLAWTPITAGVAQVNTDWNATSGVAELLNKPATFPPSVHGHTATDITGLAVVATTGSYTDLSNKPVIPAAGIPEAPLNGNVYARKDGLWVTTPQALSALNDVTILNPTTNSILNYDGSKWGNTNQATLERLSIKLPENTNPFSIYRDAGATGGTKLVSNDNITLLSFTDGTHITQFDLLAGDFSVSATGTSYIKSNNSLYLGNSTIPADNTPPSLYLNGYHWPVVQGTTGQVLAKGAGNELVFVDAGTGGGGGIPDAPIDGTIYGRKDALWEPIPSGGALGLDELLDVIITTPATGNALVFDGLGIWKNTFIDYTTLLNKPVILPDAPNDANTYGRKANAWAVIPAAPVVSVNTKTGVVVLTNTDVGAAPTVHTHTAAQVTGLATVATTGSYTDLSNKPAIPAAQVSSDWNSVTSPTNILNKPVIPAAQVNSDWNAVSGVAQILNKPVIPAAGIPEAPQNGNVYARKDATWVTTPQALSALSDVTVSNPVNGHSLVYNGTKWVNQTPSGGGGSTTLDGLSDVDTTGAANGTLLAYYDGTWIDANQVQYLEIKDPANTSPFIMSRDPSALGSAHLYTEDSSLVVSSGVNGSGLYSSLQLNKSTASLSSTNTTYISAGQTLRIGSVNVPPDNSAPSLYLNGYMWPDEVGTQGQVLKLSTLNQLYFADEGVPATIDGGTY